MALSFDNSDKFDLPAAQRAFNLRLMQIQPFVRTDTTRGLAAAAIAGRRQWTQHQLGLAADIRTRDLTQEQILELIARAKAAGLVVVDETKKPGQPHVHVQAFKAGTIPKSVYRSIGVQITENP